MVNLHELLKETSLSDISVPVLMYVSPVAFFLISTGLGAVSVMRMISNRHKLQVTP